MRHLILCEVLLAVPVAVPLDMPAPKPGGPVIKAPCVCGDACKCAAGTCPGKCPAAPLPRVVEAVPPGYPPPPAGFRWERYPSGQWGLVQNGVRVPQLSPAKATPVSHTPVGPSVLCGPTG